MVKSFFFFKLTKWKTSTYFKFIQRWQERRNQKDGEQMPKQKTRPNMVEISQTMWTVTSRAKSEGSFKKLETWQDPTLRCLQGSHWERHRMREKGLLRLRSSSSEDDGTGGEASAGEGVHTGPGDLWIGLSSRVGRWLDKPSSSCFCWEVTLVPAEGRSQGHVCRSCWAPGVRTPQGAWNSLDWPCF